MTRVKICGLRTVAAARAAVEAGADFLGFVFAPSRRQVAPRLVQQLLADLPSGAYETVGVFVDAPPHLINAIAETCRLDWVQLCGQEPPDLCAQLRVPVIKSFRVAGPVDLETVARYMTVCRLVHLDTYRPGQAGGTGETFDWSLAVPVARRWPTMLAGGLDAANVARAIQLVQPYAVDVSSGVETAGEKDPAKIAAFIAAVRRATATAEHTG